MSPAASRKAEARIQSASAKDLEVCVAVKDPLWVMRLEQIPIGLQLFVAFVCIQVLEGLQIADKAVPVVQNQRDAVPAVAGGGDDLSRNADFKQEAPAFPAGQDGRPGFVDRLNGKAALQKDRV